MPLSAVFLPFLPAGLALLIQAASPIPLSERLLALALALFCPELAYMAFVDLKNIVAIAHQQDSRLKRFARVTHSTIVLETVGFYTALVSLPVGAVIIIASQLWFNLLADIQLWPEASPAIVSWPPSRRRAVLIANGLGLGLLGLWPIQEIRIWLTSGLLTLATLFLVLKYSRISVSADPAD